MCLSRRSPLSNFGLRFRHVALDEDGRSLKILIRVPAHRIRWYEVNEAETVRYTIEDMVARRHPLIGIVGAFGLALELAARDSEPRRAGAIAGEISSARPTAVNLPRAVNRILEAYKEKARR